MINSEKLVPLAKSIAQHFAPNCEVPLERNASCRPRDRFENLEQMRSLHFKYEPTQQFPQERLSHNSILHKSSKLIGCTCFVFYLPRSATNETLRLLFEPYGTILNTYVPMDRITNQTRGFGFVDFSTPEEAQIAVDNLDKHYLDGRYLSVSIKI